LLIREQAENHFKTFLEKVFTRDPSDLGTKRIKHVKFGHRTETSQNSLKKIFTIPCRNRGNSRIKPVKFQH